jgi:transposase
LAQTEKILAGIKVRVEARRLSGEGAVSMAIGQVINKYKMKKHFILSINDHEFEFSRNVTKIKAEEFLDGLYVIRTSLDKDCMSPENCVRSYKKLTQVERAFRSMKTTDIKVRPVHHYAENRVRSHFFICMLAYYVIWHMKEAWREITFADEKLSNKETADPVAPALRSDGAVQKSSTKVNSKGMPVGNFQTTLLQLSTHSRKRQCLKLLDNKSIKYIETDKLTPFQKKALDLLKNIKAYE